MPAFDQPIQERQEFKSSWIEIVPGCTLLNAMSFLLSFGTGANSENESTIADLSW
jgi:hypothetical protein